MTRTSRDTLVMNGINNHPHQRAELDFYATEPKQVRLLLGIEDLSGARILEPCCGTGSIAQVLTEAGLEVEASDIADRGFGRQQDFFTIPSFDGHIVTNPPFTRAVDFVSHALSIIPKGRKACFFLKLTFLEGIKRRHFFDITPPQAHPRQLRPSHLRPQRRFRIRQRQRHRLRMVRLGERIPGQANTRLVQP